MGWGIIFWLLSHWSHLVLLDNLTSSQSVKSLKHSTITIIDINLRPLMSSKSHWYLGLMSSKTRWVGRAQMKIWAFSLRNSHLLLWNLKGQFLFKEHPFYYFDSFGQYFESCCCCEVQKTFWHSCSNELLNPWKSFKLN